MRVLNSGVNWTQISRSDVSKATEILRGDERGIRDEIGFLALHQGFADRFFPGTSVLQTRLRYVLFVPWQMNDAVERARDREGAARAALRRSEQRLVGRLLQGARERQVSVEGIIGSRSPDHDPGQPPSTIFWSALREWRVLQPLANNRAPSREHVLSGRSRLKESADDGGEPDSMNLGSSFYSLPDPPREWTDPDASLDFGLEARERTYLLERLGAVPSLRNNGKRSLLACMALAGPQKAPWRKTGFEGSQLRALAEVDDVDALRIASYASALTHIGRAAYSALVEHVVEQEDGREVGRVFRERLEEVVAESRGEALSFDMGDVEGAIGRLELHFKQALEATRRWLKAGRRDARELLAPYKAAEVYRKPGRARLADYAASPTLRQAWMEEPEQRTANGLGFRWNRVGQLIDDLHGA